MYLNKHTTQYKERGLNAPVYLISVIENSYISDVCGSRLMKFVNTFAVKYRQSRHVCNNSNTLKKNEQGYKTRKKKSVWAPLQR